MGNSASRRETSAGGARGGPRLSTLRPRAEPSARDRAVTSPGLDALKSKKTASAKGAAAAAAGTDSGLPLGTDTSTFLLSKLELISKTPEICDVVFVVGKEAKKFYSVKAILGAQNPAFAAAFTDAKTDDDGKIRIDHPDVEPEAFEIMMTFLHTGNLVAPKKSVKMLESLLNLCGKYNLKDISEMVLELTQDEINDRTVLPLYNMATKYKDEILSEACLKHILDYAEELLKTEEFMKFATKDVLLKLLPKDDLRAEESTIYNFILDWGKKQTTSGEEKSDLKTVLADIIPLVRLALFPTQFLLDDIAASGLFDEEQIIELLALQADKTALAKKVKKRKAPKIRRAPGRARNYVTRTATSLISHTGTRIGPATPYTSTHDGGAVILNNLIFTHYGNDGAGGNRVHVISVEPGTPTRVVNLPFQTHGSYPAADPVNNFVYVFEDSDGGHGNGFGRINADTLEFENLPAVPGAHCRYSNGCVQSGRFWKMAAGYSLFSFDFADEKWVSTGTSFGNNGILMSDPTDEDIIWIMQQGNNLQRYIISENRTTVHSNCPSWFNLGANYPCFLIPGDEGIFVCAYVSGTWHFYNSQTNSWSTISYPYVSEGGHCFYDLETGHIYFQANGSSNFTVIDCPDDP